MKILVSVYPSRATKPNKELKIADSVLSLLKNRFTNT